MRRTFFVSIILISIVSSCAKGYGTAYIQKNLTIYYINNKDINLVKSLSNYWFEHKLIGRKSQSLRLYHDNNKVNQLQLISNDLVNVKKLNFEEIKALQELENDLNKTIFQNNKIDLVVCDSRFNVVNDLNY